MNQCPLFSTSRDPVWISISALLGRRSGSHATGARIAPVSASGSAMMNAALSGAASARVFRDSRVENPRAREGSVSRFQISALEPAHHGGHREHLRRRRMSRKPCASASLASRPTSTPRTRSPRTSPPSRDSAPARSRSEAAAAPALPFVLPDSHPLARVEDSLMEHAGEVKTRGMGSGAISNEALVEPRGASRAGPGPRASYQPDESSRQSDPNATPSSRSPSPPATAPPRTSSPSSTTSSSPSSTGPRRRRPPRRPSANPRRSSSWTLSALAARREAAACGADAPAFPVPPRDSPVSAPCPASSSRATRCPSTAARGSIHGTKGEDGRKSSPRR